MTLVQLVLLGLGAKVLLGNQKATASTSANIADQTALPISDVTTQEIVAVKGKDYSMKRPQVAVYDVNDWDSDSSNRENYLSREAVNVEGSSDATSFYEEKYGSKALVAESAPLTISPKDAALAKANERARQIQQREYVLRRRSEQMGAAAMEDAIPVSDNELEMYRYRRDRNLAVDMDRESRAERRAAAIARAQDARDQSFNAALTAAQGADIARSINQNIDPNLDMALRQTRKAQKGGAFTQDPNAPFQDAQPASLKHGNFDQSEIVNAYEFCNHLSDADLKADKNKDWPVFARQQNPASDFSGILVNESGSADFSHDIVHDVKSDFGRR